MPQPRLGPDSLPKNWGDGPLQSWPPHISEADQLVERGKRLEAHMRWLSDHPEIPPSPEEASEGLVLKHIIERGNVARNQSYEQQ